MTSERVASAVAKRDSATPHALEGVTLVDFGQYLAGPFGPMIIGDLGADVIKVEPVTGDGMRFVNQPFTGCQRGKRDIGLNLKAEAGVEIALKLVERADIVHHNMTVGVADRLGIGYEDCKAVNPDVVYCNTYAYGARRPARALRVASTRCSRPAPVSSTSRGRCTPATRRCTTASACATPPTRCSRCSAASPRSYHQRRTGEGQELWTSLLDGGQMLASDALLVDGKRVALPAARRGPDGHRRVLPALRDRRRLAADRRGHAAAVRGAVRACSVRPSSSTTRASPTRPGARSTARSSRRCSGRASRRRPRSTWSRLLADAGVPCEIPVDTKGGELAFFDADNERLGLVAEYEHPILGTMRQWGTLIDFSETPGKIHGPPPLVGQHTREILEWLGYTSDEMDALRSDGVVYWPGADDYIWTV